jgi:FMN phosphatase YigB (HAD superfamily)
MRTVRTVLFDLDGTLLHTAPGLVDALNLVLAGNGRPPLPFQEVRGVVSHGGVALFGYFQAHHRPREWNADGFIHAPLELLDWLVRINGPD